MIHVEVEVGRRSQCQADYSVVGEDSRTLYEDSGVRYWWELEGLIAPKRQNEFLVGVVCQVNVSSLAGFTVALPVVILGG